MRSIQTRGPAPSPPKGCLRPVAPFPRAVAKQAPGRLQLAVTRRSWKAQRSDSCQPEPIMALIMLWVCSSVVSAMQTESLNTNKLIEAVQNCQKIGVCKSLHHPLSTNCLSIALKTWFLGHVTLLSRHHNVHHSMLQLFGHLQRLLNKARGS